MSSGLERWETDKRHDQHTIYNIQIATSARIYGQEIANIHGQVTHRLHRTSLWPCKHSRHQDIPKWLLANQTASVMTCAAKKTLTWCEETFVSYKQHHWEAIQQSRQSTANQQHWVSVNGVPPNRWSTTVFHHTLSMILWTPETWGWLFAAWVYRLQGGHHEILGWKH